MFLDEFDLEYRHDTGALTYFHVRFYQFPDRNPILIVSEAPDNRGPSVRASTDGMAQDLLDRLTLRPNEVTWIQHHADDKLEEVHFRALGVDPQQNRGPDLDAMTPEQRTEYIRNMGPLEFVEYRRRPLDKDDVLRRTGEERLDPPQSYQAWQRAESATLQVAKDFNRPIHKEEGVFAPPLPPDLPQQPMEQPVEQPSQPMDQTEQHTHKPRP